MAIFNSYVKLPEGTHGHQGRTSCDSYDGAPSG
jgi:hypothetical protein